MQCLKQHRRVDIALMVGAVNGRPLQRKPGRRGDTIANSAETEAYANANVSEHIQVPLPTEENRGEHADRPYDQDVERHDDEGEDRADGRNEHRGMINEKSPAGIVTQRGQWVMLF